MAIEKLAITLLKLCHQDHQDVSRLCMSLLYESFLHLVKNRADVYTKNMSFVHFRNGPATSYLGLTMLLLINIEIAASVESMTS